MIVYKTEAEIAAIRGKSIEDLKKMRHLIIEKFNFRDARQIIYQNKAEQTNKPQPACV